MKFKISFWILHLLLISMGIPGSGWIIKWNNQEEDVALVYSDDNVEFYADSYIPPKTSFTFKPISKAWKHLRNLYNSTYFGNNPKLYIIFRESVNNSQRTAIHFDKIYNFRNVINCENDEVNDINGDLISYADVIQSAMVDIVAKLIIKSYALPPNLMGVSGWRFLHILRYNLFNELGSRYADAYKWSSQDRGTVGFPQTNILLLHNWYFPIYTEHQESRIIHRFLALIESYAKKYTLFTNTPMLPGEFVHIWNEAAEADLRILAFKVFGWTQEYKVQFKHAAERFGISNYEDAFNNVLSYTPPIVPQAKLVDFVAGQKFNFFRVHFDKDVAFYFKDSAPKNTTWLFQPMKDAWNYVKESFGPFSPDPYLYIVLDFNGNNFCKSSKGEYTYLNTRYDGLIAIYCDMNHLVEAINTKVEIESDLDNLLQALSLIILYAAKETGNWPGLHLSQNTLSSLLVYDIYINIGRVLDAERWIKKQFLQAIDKPSKNTFWFRDWFYPIYLQQNNSKALVTFFAQLKMFWPSHGTDYIANFNLGSFVHFWSMAVGSDLRKYAYKAFGWTGMYSQQFRRAQQMFPSYSYSESFPEKDLFNPPETWDERWSNHSEHLICIHVEDKVAFYVGTGTNFDFPDKSSTLRLFKTLSQVWSYAELTYGPFGLDPMLYIILHTGTYEKDCILSKHRSMLDSNFERRLVIDLQSINLVDAEVLNKLVQCIGKIVQRTVGQVGNWPANDVFDTLVYDFFVGTGKITEAEKWLGLKLKTNANQSAQFGHRKSEILNSPECNWSYPIYATYGKTQVLKTFFNLLSKCFPRTGDDVNYLRKMDSGELVHFWSGAAGVNLASFANRTFQLSLKDFVNLAKARKAYSEITYETKEDLFLETEKKENKKQWTIITTSVTIGVLILVSIAVLITWHFRKTKRLRARIRKLKDIEIKTFFDGNSSTYLTDGDASVESKPFNMDYEISRDQLEIFEDHILGEGEFGNVCRGKVRLNNSPSAIPEYFDVAVKTPKRNIDTTAFCALLSELKVMVHVGTHEYIVKLVGTVTVGISNRELFVAFEYCAKGDLLTYIRSNRNVFKNYFESIISIQNETVATPSHVSRENNMVVNSMENVNFLADFSTLNLLDWAHQIAMGMEYIGFKNVIHGDLAARNILLNGSGVAKISDFGLSRQLTNYSSYAKTSMIRIPWRWMAPESLKDMKFSIKSDVWSFGVTLFEIFSLGEIPYGSEHWTPEFVANVISGPRLGFPQFGNNHIHQLIEECMQTVPEKRTTFDRIGASLLIQKQEHFPSSEQDVEEECIYADLNTLKI